MGALDKESILTAMGIKSGEGKKRRYSRIGRILFASVVTMRRRKGASCYLILFYGAHHRLFVDCAQSVFSACGKKVSRKNGVYTLITS